VNALKRQDLVRLVRRIEKSFAQSFATDACTSALSPLSEKRGNLN
jgi:hypothetical protein